MQTLNSILLVINHPQNPVDALILTKKLAQLAKQQGFESHTISVKDQIPDIAFNKVIFIGQTPTQLDPFKAYPVVTISLEQANQDIQQAFEYALTHAQPIDQLKAETQLNNTQQAQRFVAITACPTGVAHTFMAAEALQQGANKLGYQIDVETQGSVGAKNILTDEAIAAADIVILATDIEVNTDRFVGKRVYRCSTGFALKQTDKAFAEAISEATVLESSKQSKQTAENKSQEKTGVYKHLLTGVS